MSDESKCVVDGVTYVAKPGPGCAGCAGHGKPNICAELGECLPWGRDDDINVIWIKSEDGDAQ